ncbi:extracellular calcium-sensing receptor [Hydra vulgaris]|uniref:extracellular calcium-sensing receptor n=1 Tax=Hydra vulgaris TaxID=6087 RepID=UPI001F5FC328|nr:extracellular calcium-sensing receptor [Hydra vulgaris]
MENKIESVVEGDFKIIGLFPMGCSTPSNIDNRTIAWMEAVKYTINEENSLHNKSIFGYVIYDTHNTSNTDKTTFAVLDSFLYSSLSNTNEYNNISESNGNNCNNKVNSYNICADLNENLNNSKILGFVGPAESSISIYVNQLTLPYKHFPIISYAATSLELDDKNLYPNFFRTTSSDAYQADFISDLIKKTNSNYISLLWVDSSYGRGGKTQQINSFQKNGICIDYMDKVPNNFEAKKYAEISMYLHTSLSKVIVFWGTFLPLRNLLQITIVQNLTNKIWIVSEAVGKNSFFFNYPNIFLVVQTDGEDLAFKNYFYGLSYQNSSQWLKIVFQKYKVNENTTNFTVKNISEVFDLSKVVYVQNAVKALIQSFFCYQKLVSLNQKGFGYQSINNRTKFLELLKQVNFSTLNEFNFTFSSNHNPQSMSYFELYTCPSNSFQLVAKWSNYNKTNESRLIIENKRLLSNIFSVCSDPCELGFIRSGNFCCWTCNPCPDNSADENCYQYKRLYWNLESNELLLHQVLILLFSIIGIMTSIFFIFTFLKKKLTLIVRSSNYELTLLQMTMHLVMFVLPLLAFGEETQEKCIARIYIGTFLHVTIVTIILVKVKRLIATFNHGIHSLHSKKKLFVVRSHIGVMLVFFPCVFIALIFVVHNHKYKIYVSDDINIRLHTVQKHCESASFLVFYLCYVIFLSLLCGFQSFKAKNVPSKFNENIYIAYSLFLSCITLCVMLGLMKSNFDSNNKKFSYCLLMNISNFFLIVILFFNKIRTLWMNEKMKPQESSRIEYVRKSIAIKHSNDTSCSNVLNQNKASTDVISAYPENAIDALSLATTNALPLAITESLSLATTDALSVLTTDALSLATTDTIPVTNIDAYSVANTDPVALENTTQISQHM